MSKICDSSEKNAACCLEIPNSLLEVGNKEKQTSGKSMVEQLNESLPRDTSITVEPGCPTVEERIRVKACFVSKKISLLKTHYKKSQMKKKCTKLNIYVNELMSVSQLNEQVKTLEQHEESC